MFIEIWHAQTVASDIVSIKERFFITVQKKKITKEHNSFHKKICFSIPFKYIDLKNAFP